MRPDHLFRSLLVTTLLTPAAASLAPAEEAPLRANVMTFNIRLGAVDDGPNHWQKRREMVFDVVRGSGADFVGLQEAMVFQIDEIREALGGYDMVSRTRRADVRLDEASAILYRRDRWLLDQAEQGTFWLADDPTLPGSMDWGNRYPRIVTWARFVERASGRGLYVFNTHFDHESQPSREKSGRLLAERIAARRFPEPFVVTGDFNAGEDNAAIGYLKGAEGAPVKLVDTFRVVHPDATETGTFNSWRGERTGPKIDYVFVEPAASVVSARIHHDEQDGRNPSDHFPVSAVVEWK